MASLPSYQEAVSPDWLPLVAPYVSPKDYPALCRVSRRYWDVFAPRIWSCIPHYEEVAGHYPDPEYVSSDLDWLLNSVFNRVSRMRPETLSLVRVFDARFIRGTYSLSMGTNLNTSLKNAVKFLPNLNCILVDGHEDLDPSEFLAEAGHQVQLLSLAGCPQSLSAKFITSLRSLVFLDLSYVPGSLRPLFQSDELPELRVLKVQGKEVDDTTVENLTARFGSRLWSLDLSNNKLTDRALESIGAHCLWPADLRSAANFDVEGKLEFGCTTPDFGTWIRIVESELSGSFSHPNRHFVDAPLYDLHDTLPQEFVSKRLDGKFPVKSDAANGVCRGLQGEDPYFPPASFQNSQGLTHLDVSRNRVSSLGLTKLLTLCRGRLEQFSCDSMMLVPPLKGAMAAVWPMAAKLHGFYATHTLRPVLSSNLRVVKLHHSVVTQIPTLELEGLSSMACLYIAENILLPRAEMAFPEPFVPDMNPRIISLTLTRIPRRSSGPLINRLISFLKLLSEQERALFDLSSRRGPSVLAGLRHFRLEFEQDAHEEDMSIVGQGIDAEELLNSGDRGFSFFDDEAKERPQPVRELTACPPKRDLTDFSVSQREKDLGLEHLDIDVWVDGKRTRVKVWVGSRDSSNPMLQDYRELALRYEVHDHIGPASPAQIRAGVPSSALVFHTAWCMAIMPCRYKSVVKEPTRVELDAMRDVLAELKQFRVEGRAKYLRLQRRFGSGTAPPGPPPGFWLGKLEVSTHQRTLRSKTADYWR
ncbi:hypothetical protein FBEOM_9775 [Fusarium beomiforme]|uniref:Leucine rich repeat domain containing protein n=1 Tax=Fusarium beomiforme TaxID=44412 RepID=A0A9P5AE88_9HYPO|nr:hypothetical protein FBEOM_9775 [Fusarium beomiforme]